MNLLKCTALSLALSLNVVAPVHASDADVEALQQQVEALTKRVAELEKHMKIMDSPKIKKAIKEVTGPSAPGDSGVAENWEFLKVGYDYTEVRELLGEPVSVKKGGMEFWFYSDKGLKGPFVKFLFRKVNDWKAPGE